MPFDTDTQVTTLTGFMIKNYCVRIIICECGGIERAREGGMVIVGQRSKQSGEMGGKNQEQKLKHNLRVLILK